MSRPSDGSVPLAGSQLKLALVPPPPFVPEPPVPEPPVPEPPAEHDLDYRTHFERRTRKNQEPVYRAEFRK